jgi:hypothetical protein
MTLKHMKKLVCHDRLGEDTVVSAYQKRSPASQLEDAEKCSWPLLSIEDFSLKTSSPLVD